MTRFRRLLIPLLINFIILILCLNFLPDLQLIKGLENTLYSSLSDYFQPTYRNIASISPLSGSLLIKFGGVLLIVVITLFTDIIYSGYFKLWTFTIVSLGLSTLFVSVLTYKTIGSGSIYYSASSLIFAVTVVFMFAIFEVVQRLRYKKLVKGSFTGNHLKSYSKAPWNYFDNNGVKEKELSILYFYMPELCTLANKSSDKKMLLEIVNTIYSKCYSIVDSHNGIFIRRMDENMIIFFEPGIYYDKTVSEESSAAYHAICCALELKQMIQSIIEKHNTPILEQLKANIVISTGNSLVMSHLRNGRIELSLFGETLLAIENIIAFNNNSDIVVDNKTYNLCSLYFRTQELSNSAVAVLGISTWS